MPEMKLPLNGKTGESKRCVPGVSGGLRTFEPALVLLSALQLRRVLQVEQQVGQEFTPFVRPLVGEEAFRRFDEGVGVPVCAQQLADVAHHWNRAEVIEGGGGGQTSCHMHVHLKHSFGFVVLE